VAHSLSHPFIIGERYADRRGDYTVIGIEGDRITIEYDDGMRDGGAIEVKARIYKNILVEQRSLHPIQTEGYFYFLGFLAGHSEFNAEVPPQSQASFEEQHFLLTGIRPRLHSQGYFPIRIETTWDKWAPELRIIFPDVNLRFDLPPDIEIRAGNEPGVVRINNNKFWRLLVRIGFRLGREHNVEMIRASIPSQFREAFDNGAKFTK
jgi:hypothetical protein